MRIRHTRLTRDFLQVPNATVRDDRLSHMARGILVELLSRPDGWKATADDMWRASVAKHGKGSPGRRQFRAAFAELKEHGYLTAEKELGKSGQLATVLSLTDISAARTDVPASGTSARPGVSGVSAGGTDVPHGGTSDASADVPHAGTSERPAETSKTPGGTGVPLVGTSERPAETGISAARTDVPHGGTSNTEHEKTNTGENTSSSTAIAIRSEDEEDAHLEAFGAFWMNYPKKQHRPKAKTEWISAIRRGVDPAHIVAAAQSYARDRAGKDPQYTSYPANWLRNERYDDEFPPEPDGRPALFAVGTQPASRQQQETNDLFDRAMVRAQTRMQQETS